MRGKRVAQLRAEYREAFRGKRLKRPTFRAFKAAYMRSKRNPLLNPYAAEVTVGEHKELWSERIPITAELRQ